MTAHPKSGPSTLNSFLAKGKKPLFRPFFSIQANNFFFFPFFYFIFLRAKMTKKAAHGRKSYRPFEQ